MAPLVLVAACLGLGALLRWSGFPVETPRVLDQLVLFVALPALVLARRSGLHLGPDLWLPMSMAWLQLALAGLVVGAVGGWLGWSRSRRAALVLTAGFANTSFLGWPLVEALLGAKALPTAIVVDQLGSFVAVSTAGLAIAAWGSGASFSPRAIGQALARFPALPALGLGWVLANVPMPPIDAALEHLGGLLTPLALLSVGFRLEPVPALGTPLVVGLGTKLVLAPLALGGLYALAGVPLDLPLQTTLLEAAMPPMITAGILAADRGLEPPLARAMVGLGTPLGAGTVVLWSVLLTR